MLNISDKLLNALYWGIKDTGVWKSSSNLFFAGDKVVLQNVHEDVRGLYFLFLREREVYVLKKKLIKIYRENESWKRLVTAELKKWLLNTSDAEDLMLITCMFKNIDHPSSKYTFYVKNKELRQHLQGIFKKVHPDVYDVFSSYRNINSEGLDFPLLPVVYRGYPEWYNMNYEKEERDENFPKKIGYGLLIFMIIALLFQTFS